MKLAQFSNNQATVNFIRILDRAFDILNSKKPMGKGYKQPPRQQSEARGNQYLNAQWTICFHRWIEKAFNPQSKNICYWFCYHAIKSRIEMLDKCSHSLKILSNRCKFSQDHIELLFSSVRSEGVWNNNANILQLKYALRKMLFRNAVKT